MSEARASASPRSWLFVPGDSERKQARAFSTGADAVILDLEDSVDPAQLPAARVRVAGRVGAGRSAGGPQLWVRVNTPASGAFAADLAAVCASAMPDGLVLPKISAAAEIVEVSAQLSSLEAARDVAAGSTRLLIIATETPRGLLALPQYPPILGAAPASLARVAALTWGAEDLGAVLGALAKRDAAGALTFTFQMARTLCLLTAAALGVQAVDGVHTDIRDGGGLQRELTEARRDGFAGKLAIHPDQIAPINSAFTPSAAEREHARRVVAAFAAAAGAGVVSLDGQMIDRPHLIHAQRVLAAGPAGESP